MLTEEITPVDVREVVLPPGGGDVVAFGMTIKLRSEQTGGAFALLEGVMPGRTQGPGLHMHTREDETTYILEGALKFRIGEQTFTATAGSTVFKPKGIPHTFCNPFDEPARVLAIVTPGGFERFFEDQVEIMKTMPQGARPDPEALQALAGKYGGVLLGPPMPLDE
jgi:mannose-6-phosphate isomerase-like protein (cupin superfamily)